MRSYAIVQRSYAPKCESYYGTTVSHSSRNRSHGKHCKYPSQHNLTRDEAAALYLYTMEAGEYSFYCYLNQTLREEDRRKAVPWFRFLKLLDSALNKLPIVKGCIWRGVRQVVSQQYQKNEIVTWWSVNSCSSSVGVVEKFLATDDNSTLFMIEAANGRDISAYTIYPYEEEVILKMGTRLHVKNNALKYGKLHLVHLKEVEEPVMSTIPPYPSRWEANAVTVAGFFLWWIWTPQLTGPCGLFVDDDQTVYIADCGNHRIMAMKAGATTGEVVAGGNGEGNRLDQLNGPIDVIVDRETDSLLICDIGNERVMRWPRRSSSSSPHQGEIVIDNILCWGLTMDDQGSLYVSDIEKHEVRRYDKGGDKKGTVVAGGYGQGDNLNQLNFPTSLFVDAQSTLYVSDCFNSHVMKWMKGAKEGIVVAGGNGEGRDLTQLSHPRGVWVDGFGHVYVVDTRNHREMRWEKGAKQGTVIVGGNGEGKEANQLYHPKGLFFDLHGHLYVSDWGNDRVQRFSLIVDK